MKGLGGKIFGLVVSIGLIIGGLSGNLVLRGTNSSMALVAAGFVFLALDIYQLATHGRTKQTMLEEASAAEGGERLDEPAHITVTRESSVLGAAIAYQVYLNGTHVGDVKNGKELSFDTTARVSSVAFSDPGGNLFKDKVVLDMNAGSHAQIFVKSGKVLTDRTTHA